MRINKINLRNFRNYQNLTLQFAPGINVLSGPNGAGKTNIVEAIFYLAFASSFKRLGKLAKNTFSTCDKDIP